jgi:hypothetical protein
MGKIKSVTDENEYQTKVQNNEKTKWDANILAYLL